MRYIQKKEIPSFMKEWIELRENTGQALSYNDFDKKKELNEILRQEQKYVCCYCQQRITKFKQNNNGDCHNEHLIPQKGKHGDVSKQMDYYNIYASCSYSDGYSQKQQYCGSHKADNLISPIIQNELSSTFFKYNALGEILPNSDLFKNYLEFTTHKNQLDNHSKEVLTVIQELNLNATFLVQERKKLQTRIFNVLNKVSKEKIQQKMEDFENTTKFYPFIDMLLYYMTKKK